MGAQLFIRCETMTSSKINLFGLCENAWFLWQPIADSRMGWAYKITYISAVSYPRQLDVVPN